MADSSEIEKLKARIEELDQQLVEERDEFEWDLKAAKESSDQTIRKLEGELERLKSTGASASATQPAEPGKPEDVKMLTQRALLAERRVAELQEELKRASQLTPPPAPKGDPLLRQRAEAAERERDDLRKEKRALERSVQEKKSSIERLKKDQEETRGLKRKLESAKKDLVDREKELRNARDTASGQGDLSAALEEKETKIRELAQELNNLAAVEVERDSLIKEMEQLQADTQKQQSSRDEKDSTQVAGLEAEVERLKQELAQLQLASGQMVEQRERETARLKADLQEVSEKEATFAGQTDQTKRELTRLRDELVVTSRERDELVAQLRGMREEQETGVYVMDKGGEHPADAFAEDTQQVTIPRGSEETSQTETIRDGTPLGASDLAPGEAEDLFPEGGFVQEEVTQKAKPAFAKGETRRAEVPPSPMEDSASEDELAPPAVESVPLAKVEVEEPVPDLMSPSDEEPPEQTQDVRTERTTQKPPHESLRVARPKRKGSALLKVAVFGILAGVLVAGAYYLFPMWFGLGDAEDGGTVVEAADAGETSDVDAAVVTAPADAPVPDAGAEEAAADEVDVEDDIEEPVEPKEPTAKMKKAHEFAAKLLKKKRFNKAVKFLEGWVQKEPSDPTFRYLSGRAKSAKRWYKGAAEELEKAIELDPGRADAYYELGGVYIRMKDTDKACQALKKFVELAPSDRRKPAVKMHIRKLNCP